MPYVRRRHHPREPKELDRGSGRIGGRGSRRLLSPVTRSLAAPDSPSTIQDTKHYLQDFDRVQKTATSDQELFDQMTELYPHWVANQSWLMFGFPQP